MSDTEPCSQREYCYRLFPRWFVDWILAPFSDESGKLPVYAKNGAIGLVLSVFLLEVGSETLLDAAVRAVAFLVFVLIVASVAFHSASSWTDPFD